jgi:hypothetical protein
LLDEPPLLVVPPVLLPPVELPPLLVVPPVLLPPVELPPLLLLLLLLEPPLPDELLFPLEPPTSPPPPLAGEHPKGDIRSPTVRGTSRKYDERCMRVSPSDDGDTKSV